MHIVSDSFDKGRINNVNSVNSFHLNNNWSDIVNDFVFVLWLHQIRYFSCIQKIVDIF